MTAKSHTRGHEIYYDEETGEMETYHMIQKGDAIYVSKMLYSHLIRTNGTIL